MPRRLALCLAFSLFAFLGGLAGNRLFQSPAMAQQAPKLAPRKIGVVNLRKVFMGYNKTNARQKEIQVKYRKIQTELKKTFSLLERRKVRLANYKKDDPIYRKKLAKLAEEYDGVKAQMAWSKEGLTAEMQRYTEEIFREILAAVTAYGKAQNYRLILKYDDQDIASTSSDQLKAKLAQKQVLYFHPPTDLSAEITKQLNDQYR